MDQTTSAAPPLKKPTKMKKYLKVLGLLTFTLLLVALFAGLFVWQRLRGSLPVLDGTITVTSLSKEVIVDRDKNGVPTITAENHLDLVRTLGFLHAQDRFFQMDGMRRLAAGELSAVFGTLAVDTDVEMRRHQLRNVARSVYRRASTNHRQIMEAYAAGVNEGLGSMQAPPFEHLLVKATPEPWQVEDTILVVFAMALDLQNPSGEYEKALGVMQDTLPPELFEFLTPWGSEWDAPLEGPALPPGEIPGPEVIDLRKAPKAAQFERQGVTPDLDLKPGSNNWAIGGALTAYKSGMIANDMHLNLRIPHTWYRAQLIWKEGDELRKQVGVTLPGTPALIAGSNGHIAWGFTNSYLDWSDVIRLEPVENLPNHYQTPNGPLPIENVSYTLEVKDGEPQIHSFEKTIWGPIIGEDHLQRKLVVNWTAHHPEATNLALLDVSITTSVADALILAKRCGMPGQNIVVADKEGHIGWTIAGIIPKRVGFDGRLPTSWADGKRYWDGWLETDAYPEVYDPDQSRIWTANARVVDPSYLPRVGESGYALGARAQQIRDRLFERAQFSEQEMLAIQLDDEARFLTRWRTLLLAQLKKREDENSKTLYRLVDQWSGRASVDDVGYRVVRHFRSDIIDTVLDALTQPCALASSEFDSSEVPQREGIAWKLVSQQPNHLLSPDYVSWNALFQAQIDRIIEFALENSGTLEAHTWGKFNTLRMNHRFSDQLSFFKDRLNMAEQPLAGDGYMPRVQGPKFGASERMVVAPSHEDKGIFHMPGGQSGHPLSPFYRAGHDDWAEGRPSPLLPGKRKHQLILKPGSP